jgi:hypothetical protein
MDMPDVVGAVGVALILIAFLLNLVGRMERDSSAYLGLNLVGSVMACVSSALIGFVPFVVLEGVWAVASAAGLVRMYGARAA